MTPAMEPMKRCARCGRVRHEHQDDGLCPNERGRFNPVTRNWCEPQREEMARAEAIYDLGPDIQRRSGLPVPFEDATPHSQARCVAQAKVELWTGVPQ